MATRELKPNEIMQQLNGALQLFDQAQAPLLEGFAARQNRRDQRLEKIEARIAARVGQDHPRVVALRQARARTTQLQRILKDDATRTAKLRALKPHEWMVYGQVVDSRGNPVAGVTVRVYDQDRKYDDLLGYTTTDRFGDFQLIYHERTFYEPGEGAPELYLRVEDAAGNELYSTRDRIRHESGRVEYFLIELERTKEGQ